MPRRPLNGSPTISQGFGENGFDYSPYGLKGHHGVDYAVVRGTPVYATESGVIEKSANGITDKYTGRGAAGETITLIGSMEHWFMHLQTRLVSAGQRVNEGDLIGYSNNTGVSTGDHLHWGTRPLNPDLNNGYRGFTNPADWLFKPTPPPVQPPQPAKVPTKPTQRLLTNTSGVNQRQSPDHNALVLKEWKYETGPAADNVYNFKGYVRGTDPYSNGNNIWFLGASSGGYFYSGAFQGASDVTGLPDLSPVTPPPVLPPLPVDPPTGAEPTKDPLVSKVYNKKNPVGQYAPSDLVSIGNNQQLRKEAAETLALMNTASASALVYGSGYRSYQTQSTLYDNYVRQDGQAEADRYSARPGYSEHQTGLTLDFQPIDDIFKTTIAYTWLTNHAHKFGWILRYPQGKEDVTGYMNEPWHWRYVGVTVATDMKSKGILTLEEYFNVPGGDYISGETPEPPSDLDKENNAILKTILALLQGLVDKISKIFK